MGFSQDDSALLKKTESVRWLTDLGLINPVVHI